MSALRDFAPDEARGPTDPEGPFPECGLLADDFEPRGLLFGTIHHRWHCPPSKQENACADSSQGETEKMNHTPDSLKTARKNLLAFTLIELLVVIAIIAILASLLMPAANSAINSAKKTTAKNQAVQIATAITAYETEYGRLPSDQTYSSVNAALVNMLCTTNDTANNPRGLIFLEANIWKNGKGGTNANGFCDPFASTNVYHISLDTNYSNIQTGVALGGGFGTTNLTKHIMVWSTPIPPGTKTNVLINSWD